MAFSDYFNRSGPGLQGGSDFEKAMLLMSALPTLAPTNVSPLNDPGYAQRQAQALSPMNVLGRAMQMQDFAEQSSERREDREDRKRQKKAYQDYLSSGQRNLPGGAGVGGVSVSPMGGVLEGSIGQRDQGKRFTDDQHALLSAMPADQGLGVLAGQAFKGPAKPVSVGPNSSLVNPETGEEIYKGAPKPDAVTERRAQAIQQLVSRGETPERAADIVDGYIKFGVNPITGQPITKNIVTGAGSGSARQDAQPQVELPPFETVFGTLAEGVGVVPALKRAGSMAGGQFSSEWTSESAVSAKAKLDKVSQLVRLAFTYGGRPSNLQIQMAMQNMPDPTLDNPETARVKLTELHKFLSDELQTANRIYGDPSAPPESKKEAYDSATNLARALRSLGNPSFAVPQTKELQGMSDEELLRALGQ